MEICLTVYVVVLVVMIGILNGADVDVSNGVILSIFLWPASWVYWLGFGIGCFCFPTPFCRESIEP